MKKIMRPQKDETKPEGFHAEFERNAKLILCIGAVTMIIISVLIKCFYNA
jgi:hypothetical protein